MGFLANCEVDRSARGWLINKLHAPKFGFLLQIGAVFVATAGSCLARDFEILSDFDSSMSTCVYTKASAANNASIGGYGRDSTNGVRVSYSGNSKGSTGVVFQCPLAFKSRGYELQFDVKFEEGFQFTRGGKLHGLGPRKVMSGGKGIDPSGWSTRVIFGSEGRVGVYYYHQDQKGRFGDFAMARDFRFEVGRYYRLRLVVDVNTQPSASDGYVQLFIDNQLVVEKQGIRFFSIDDGDVLVSKFLFSTFHGGSTSAWAPVASDGSFATVNADFDNFSVSPF